MDPVFTVPYSEFCVAQQLTRLLPSKQGYSIFAPLSRQEKGVDLVVTKRAATRSRVATIQVKASRTYSPQKVTTRTKRPLLYHTWYNAFECPPEADFFFLLALYPAIDLPQKRELGSWWAPQILVFSQAEMKQFLSSVRTVAGNPDKMFGFGFNDPKESFQTRGDPERQYRDFSAHLLARRTTLIEDFLAAG